MAFTLDVALLFLFLLVNLGVGLWYARDVRTVQQYAVGDKQFPTWIITLTIVATWLSASSFNHALRHMYHNGWVGLFRHIVSGFALYFMGSFVALRMGPFLNRLSLAGVMGSVYGRGMRFFVALVSIFSCVLMVANQLDVCGRYLEGILGWHVRHATLGIGGLLILYTTLGGLRSVTFTDVLQFMVFALFVPLFLLLVFYHQPAEGVLSFPEVWQEANLSIAFSWNSLYEMGVFTVKYLLPYVLSHGLFTAPFQRTLMSKNVYQVKRSFRYAALIWFIIVGFLFALSLLLKSRGIDPKGADFWPRLLNNELPVWVFPGFKGLAACAILAMCISTADSYGQAGGVHLYDIMQSVRWRGKSPMLWMRMGTMVLGLLSLCVVLMGRDYLEISSFEPFVYVPMVAIPLLFTLMGFRTTAKVLWTSLGLGVVAMVAWYKFVIQGYCPTWPKGEMPGFVFMPIILLATHYLMGAPGGWVGSGGFAPVRQAQLLRRHGWRRRLKSWHNFNLQHWLTQQQIHVSYFFGVGLYVLLGHLLVAFSIDPAWVQGHATLFNITLLSALLPTIFLMTYVAWPPFMQGRILRQVGYLVSVTLPLLYTTPMWLWMGGEHMPSLYVFALINLLLSCYLLDVSWVLPHVLLGCLMAKGIGQSLLNATSFLFFFPAVAGGTFSLTRLALAGFLLFASCSLVVFSRKKWHRTLASRAAVQAEAERHAEKYSWLHRQIGHIYDEFQQTDNAGKERLEKMLTEVADKPTPEGWGKLRQLWQEERIYVYKSMEGMVANLSMHYRKQSLSCFLDHLASHYQEGGKRPPMLMDNSLGDLGIVWDLDRVRGLLVTLMQQVTSDNDRLIWLSVARTSIHYPVGNRDVEAVAFNLRQGLDTSPLPVGTRYTYEELPKAFMEDELSRTISAHYGVLKQEEGVCCLILPCSMKGIRPSQVHDGHALPPELPSPDRLRTAQKVETAFWQKVLIKLPEEENEALPLLQRALRFIQYYHGPAQRKDGDLFYTHPIEVCMKVMDYTRNPVVWVAALLHDVVEDSQCTLEEVGIVFGQEVKKLVQWVSSMHMRNKKYKLAQKEEQALKICQEAPREAQLIKLCDRVHNLETLGAMPRAKQQQKIEETEQLFLPLATKIGATKLAKQLQERVDSWRKKT